MAYMGDLNSFLAENVIGAESVRYVATNRIRDAEGNPVPWEIRPITSGKDDELKKACTRYVALEGRKGAKVPVTDTQMYLGKLAAACTVFPNLNDAKLQDSHHVMGEAELLQALLTLPGEYMGYLAKVQEVCGFDTSFDEKVDDAKN